MKIYRDKNGHLVTWKAIVLPITLYFPAHVSMDIEPHLTLYSEHDMRTVPIWLINGMYYALISIPYVLYTDFNSEKESIKEVYSFISEYRAATIDN